jgi:preprotein translocase subunit SecA
MITNSIERAQKKVEENNFGTRKRLLEYDDVMNSQRSVIYSKRKNALFGDRLDVDIENMMFDVADDVAVEFKESNNYEGFKLEMIRIFGVDSSITPEVFSSNNIDGLADNVFAEVSTFYKGKSDAISNQAFSVLKDIYENNGKHIENIIVPFTDGIQGMQVAVPLNKAIENKGKEVVKSFEKTVVLSLIDDTWKEHLREMDELKQSVQNAVYEQKDPLVVYKMEAFQLFKSMLSAVNKEVISFLFKSGIPHENANEVREAKPQPKTDMSKLKVSKPEIGQETNGSQVEDTREIQKQQPIRVEVKIGRNDPCPCGSGKKYKSCHGAS